ncbi:MAG: hypothetical protein ACE5KE_14150 [Methanosarcinales archaeon]
MAIMIEGVWIYPENLRRALVFRKLLGRGKEYAIRRESDKQHSKKTE